MAREQFSDTSFDPSGPVAEPRWREPTVVLHDVPLGNIDSSLVTIEDTYSSRPIINIDRHSSAGSTWRHFLVGVDGVEDKSPLFRMNRATKAGSSSIHSSYRPVKTTDFADANWQVADATNLVGGTSGTIEWTYSGVFPAGVTYIASTITGRHAEATALAVDLLTNHSSVAAPTLSANASGVYATTVAETNHNSVSVGGKEQYSVKLDFGGATTDGQAKRKLVICAGTHAAGEGQSWPCFTNIVEWMLSDSSQAAIDFRSNWDVYLYWNFNANGLEGGNARTTFRSVTDLNRDFVSTGSSFLQETNDLRAAIEADTGGSADASFSTHGHVFSTVALMAGTAAHNNMPPRDAAVQAVFDNLEAAFGATIELQTSGTDDTYAWWTEDVLGVTCAITIEHPAMGANNTFAHYTDFADKWMTALSDADQSGVFNTGIQQLTPSLYVNPNTFYAHTVSVGSGSQTLLPSLYVNPNTFYAHTVSVGAGIQTLLPSLYVNQNIFWSASVSGGIPQPVAASVSGLTILYENYIRTATLTATSTGAGFDVNHLKNNDKSEIWRSVNLSDQVISASLSSVRTISGVAIAFSNMIQGSSYRIRVYPTSGSSSAIYDSGFQTVGYSPAPPVGFDSIGYLSFAYGGGNYLSHTFEELQGGKVDITLRSPGNPDGAIEISTIMICQSCELVRGASYGAKVSFVDESDHVNTDAGSTIIDINPLRKEMAFEIKHLPRDDRLKLEAIYRRAGSRTPVFCSLLENTNNEQDKEHFQIFGYIDQDGLARSSYDLDSTSITISEI